MSFEKIEGHFPTGKEYKQMIRERQKEWAKFLMSNPGFVNDVLKLRDKMDPGTREELEEFGK